jgi:hypothetical protein
MEQAEARLGTEARRVFAVAESRREAFWKGHNYLTLLNDWERSRVHVTEDRTQASLDGFWLKGDTWSCAPSKPFGW